MTGDKVTVTTKGSLPAAISVVGPDGGEAEASITSVGDDTFVHPAAVRPYLASGLINQRLFNVTRLISDGYDDAHMAHVPLAGSLGVDGLGSRERAMAVQVSGGRPCHHLSATRVAHRDGLPQLS
ncbi:hypothetical protein OG599_33885 [Streptomyces sp. NBC_01335]|uniref:hypothetical protein n=1 Tax=Streptomyces sp. NBC_01335 TaxID=2903828 RepID=UPI002E0D21D1|nr:hypothetical protein OG599_33885 [Streptomyces sp. NBC_01335]